MNRKEILASNTDLIQPFPKLSAKALAVIGALTTAIHPYPLEAVKQVMGMKEELSAFMLAVLRQYLVGKKIDGSDDTGDYILPFFALRLLGYWRVPETADILLDMIKTSDHLDLLEIWDDELYTEVPPVIAECLTDETANRLIPTLLREIELSDYEMSVTSTVFEHLFDAQSVSHAVIEQILNNELIPLLDSPKTPRSHRMSIAYSLLHIKWEPAKESILKLAEECEQNRSFFRELEIAEVETAFTQSEPYHISYATHNSERALLESMAQWHCFLTEEESERKSKALLEKLGISDDELWDDFEDEEYDDYDDDFEDEWTPMDDLRLQNTLWERQKPVVREESKVGRNDLCPCGSGKKFKKCCGKKG